ncbi:hypothetical protein NGF75_14465 [Dietzia kunjamensis]|uniref:hypothetical protein n=1 Tax=Dietzia kunjamensis TaxID=322509 RepID=UPI002DBCC0D2|nr:hypothetical protein [Dietzia kunjamensis]MEB8327179.1 hypothetical protein [Dietzia kunjamensis]
MIPGRAAAGAVAAAAASLALAVSGCGQVSVGERTSGTANPAVPATATATSGNVTATSSPGAAAPTATTPPPTPGPEATPGCGTLTEPVHRLVHGADTDRGAISAEVRRLSDGVTDNALSAVASRLSGIAVQPTVSPAALKAQWDQFRRLCDLP